MTAGQDKTIRLFEIDGENNPKAQGVFFNDMPILHAAFTPDGTQIIAAGRRKYFYAFDLNQVYCNRNAVREEFKSHVNDIS